MIYRILICFVLYLSLGGANAQEEAYEGPRSGVSLGNRQMVILRAGIGKIWGSYVTAVVNFEKAKEKEKFSFGISLPIETTDFQAQEGLTKDQVSLDPSGGLNVNGEFPPGTTVVSVGFVADAKGSSAHLTLPVRESAEQLLVLLQDDSMNLVSERFKKNESPEMAAVFGPGYQAFILNGSATKGEKIEFDITGIPQGRTAYYKLGAVTGILLLALGFWLAWRTRPTSLATVE